MDFSYEVEPFLDASTLCLIARLLAEAFESGSSESEEDDADDPAGPAPKRTRRQWPRLNFACSQQAQMLITNAHHDPSSTHNRDFRDTYRCPVSFFEEICDFVQPHYGKDEADCVGRPAVPFKLKVLMCFFILSTGMTFLAAGKIVGCGKETMRTFFLLFTKICATHLADRCIKLPQNEAEVQRAVDTYAQADLPGCMGSIDCTHIGWTRARASVRSWYVGKEGVPTVAFQVIVDHSTRVMAVSNVFPGTHTDKTIARLDEQLGLIRMFNLFTLFAFSVLVSPGIREVVLGVYLIADGGYQKWRVLQQTNKLNTGLHRCTLHAMSIYACHTRARKITLSWLFPDPQLRGFLAQVASSRKDVECAFGRIKNRFRCFYLFCCSSLNHAH